ncbi:hypothetical protein D3C80_2014680 [compost metagenome]
MAISETVIMISGWPMARINCTWLNCGPAKSGLSTPEKKLAEANRQKPIAQRYFGGTIFIRRGTSGMSRSCGTPIHMITSPICKAL